MVSQKLFPSEAIEVSLRVANTAPAMAHLEFWEAAVAAAKAAGYRSVDTTQKNDPKDLSRVLTMRFYGKVAPEPTDLEGSQKPV